MSAIHRRISYLEVFILRSILKQGSINIKNGKNNRKGEKQLCIASAGHQNQTIPRLWWFKYVGNSTTNKQVICLYTQSHARNTVSCGLANPVRVPKREGHTASAVTADTLPEIILTWLIVSPTMATFTQVTDCQPVSGKLFHMWSFNWVT